MTTISFISPAETYTSEIDLDSFQQVIQHAASRKCDIELNFRSHSEFARWSDNQQGWYVGRGGYAVLGGGNAKTVIIGRIMADGVIVKDHYQYPQLIIVDTFTDNLSNYEKNDPRIYLSNGI